MSTPSFIFGGNTGISYQELQSRRKVLDAMLARQGNGAPKDVGEGLNALGQGILAGIEGRMLRQAETEGRKKSSDAFSAALSAIGSPSAAGQVSSQIQAAPASAAGASPQSSSSVANKELAPYQAALLDTISGPESAGKYDVIYGGSRFNDFSQHPNQRIPIQNGPNQGKTSSAAGRYQFLHSTWEQYAKQLGLTDFSPANQDRAAWELASDTYRANTGQDLATVLQSGDAGAIAGVGKALSGAWTSLPGGIEQGTNTDRFVSAYNTGLSRYAAGGQAAPVQVASNDPSAGVAAATAPQTPVQTVAAAMPQQQAPAPSQAVQRVAQAMPQMPQAPSNSIPPEALQALQDPYLSDGQRQALQIALQQRAAGNTALYERQMMAYEQQRDAILLEQKRAYDENVRQQGFAREDAIRREGYGREDAKAATAQANNDRDFAYKVEQGNKPPTSIQEYEYARAQGFQGTLADWEQANRKASATNVNLPGQPNIGTIPQGYQAIKDEQTGQWTMSRIPGGPEDDAKANAKKADNQEISTGIVTTAAARAREALNAGGLPATGSAGGLLAALPETNAAELRRQVAVLQANAKVENLTAMRAASPTGAALGAVSDSENAMLAAKSGTLDPSSPNFARDLDDYERTLLRIVHGAKVGDAIFEQTRGGSVAGPAIAEQRPNIVPGSDAGQRYEGGVPVGASSAPVTAGQGAAQPSVRRYNPQTRRFE